MKTAPSLPSTMKKLPFTRDGFTLFLDTETGKVSWEKTDTRPNSPYADFPFYPENKSLAVLEDDYCRDALKACRRALSLTRDVHWKNRLDACNALLGMHGTEAIRGDWQNGYWCDTVAAYCNTGDTYATTIIHSREGNRFFVSSWGDYVERNSERLSIA